MRTLRRSDGHGRHAVLPAAIIAWIVSALVLFSSVGISAAGATPDTATPRLNQFDTHISHIVFIMMENHAYDNLFGTYCLVSSKYCHSTGDGIPAGTCVPRYPRIPTLGCILPFNFTVAQQAPPDLNHDWN